MKASAKGLKTASSGSKRSERSDEEYFNRVWDGMLCFLLVLPQCCHCMYFACDMSMLTCIVLVVLDVVQLDMYLCELDVL